MDDNKWICPVHTLIINYAGLRLGGIETYLVKLMKYAISKKYRVVWLTTPQCVANAFDAEIIENDYVEKVYVKVGRHWRYNANISFLPSENITMLSCEPLHFMKAESLRQKTQVNTFYHFLVLPHYTGNAYYPERYFNIKLSRWYWHRYMKCMVDKWTMEDCIRAFSLKHLQAYEKNYDCAFKNIEDKVLKSIKEIDSFDDDMVLYKAATRKNEFNIVTCSRFDFPHKGYLLGLIDVFSTLKVKYPQIQLTVIGYGEGEAQLIKKIEKLPKEISKDIVFTGALSIEQVKDQFKKGHLNVGLAGALLDGASCGNPSLVVRHYSNSCETYGFLSEVEGSLLKDDVGFDIQPYIEQIINMNDQTYLLRAKADYQNVKNRRVYDPEYFFRQKNTTGMSTLNAGNKMRGILLNLLCYIKQRFWGAEGYEI